MFGLSVGAIITGLLKAASGLTSYLEKRQDAAAEKYKAKVGAVAGTSQEALRIEGMRFKTWSHVAIAAMTHPIWWVGWTLFVIPVGFYDAKIYIVSTFADVLNTPGCFVPAVNHAVSHAAHICEWYVQQVPPAQGASRLEIMKFIFGGQAAAGASAGIAQALSNWLKARK